MMVSCNGLRFETTEVAAYGFCKVDPDKVYLSLSNGQEFPIDTRTVLALDAVLKPIDLFGYARCQK